MRKFQLGPKWLSLFLALGTPVLALANTAMVQMNGLSLRLGRGTEPFDIFTLELSSISDVRNGELFPVWGAEPYTHAALLTLTDQTWFEEIPGSLLLEVPLHDQDGNLIPDFFEVAHGVQTRTLGIYQFQGYGSGQVEAQWLRSAGSHAGTCVLNFRINPFQSLAVFTHSFEVLEYRGTLTYQPGAEWIEGTVQLEQTGRSELRWEGPVRFHRSPADPMNELILQPGGWTNASEQVLRYSTNYLFRETQRSTRYAAYFDFEDGAPDTPAPDYLTWIWSVEDRNDTDGDGVPDLSDPPPGGSPALRLEIVRSGPWIELIGVGPGTGRWQLLQTTNLVTGPWQPVGTVVLTNAVQKLLRVQPEASPRYWRAQREEMAGSDG